MQGQNVYFPASGVGQQSAFYDDEILLDGSYQIISVTIHSTSRDENNDVDTTILRRGLLLAPFSTYDDLYLPVSTEDGYVNGDTPTQNMCQAVVLAREEHMIYAYIMGNKRRRTVTAENRVVPAYLLCNIKSEKVIYNNSSNLLLTSAQWQQCQRINVVSSSQRKFEVTETLVRALRYKRKETTITSRDFN